jgi:hypothetical protein
MRDTPEFPRCLGELTEIDANTRFAGNITAAAAGRLNLVQARIDGLQAKAVLNPAKAKEYQALIKERGQLDLILMDSRAD